MESLGQLLSVALLLLPLDLPDVQAEIEAITVRTRTPEVEVSPPPKATPPPPPVKPVERTTAPQKPAGGVLACIRHYESRGNYRAVSPSGKYRNAYQMDTDFWLTYGGNPDLAGRHEKASVAEQDAVAKRGLAARGLNPWPTPRKYC